MLKLASVVAVIAAIVGQGVSAGEPTSLARPVMETADGNLDTCALGRVAGLNPDGDGYLAVRAGPGSDHKELDRITNGTLVWVFETVGDWHGVIYGAEGVDCSPIPDTRVLEREGQLQGWVHGNWVEPLAG